MRKFHVLQYLCNWQYVYVCVCIYKYVCVCVFGCFFLCEGNMCLCVCVCVCVNNYFLICFCVCVCVCVPVRVCECVCLCEYRDRTASDVKLLSFLFEVISQLLHGLHTHAGVHGLCVRGDDQQSHGLHQHQASLVTFGVDARLVGPHTLELWVVKVQALLPGLCRCLKGIEEKLHLVWIQMKTNAGGAHAGVLAPHNGALLDVVGAYQGVLEKIRQLVHLDCVLVRFLSCWKLLGHLNNSFN